MSSEHPATIRDVALRAGVHHATVSRALRNDPSISPETRQKVQQAAMELNYVKSPLVCAHMVQVRSHQPVHDRGVVAFLLPYSARQYWSKGTHRLYEGAAERAETLGYRVEVFGFADPGMTVQCLERILDTRAIYGILLSPIYKGDPQMVLTWEKYALVQLSGHSVSPEIHRVATHPYEVMRVSLQNLMQMGYRRIGLHVEKKVDINLRGEWSAALVLSQQDLPKGCRVPPLLQDGVNEEGFREWVGNYRPDVVLSLHIEAKQWLENFGMKIPGEIGFAHLDWIPELGNCAGLIQDVHGVGALAVDLVIEQLNRNERGIPKCPKTLLVQGAWRNGATVCAQAFANA